MKFRFSLVAALLVASCAGAPGDDAGDDAGEGEGEGEAEGNARLCVEPASFDFGSILVGAASAVTTFGVTNCGDAASDTLLLTAQGSFIITSFDCGQLAPAATCTVGVQFSPSAEGTEAGTVTITDASNDAVIVSIALSGIGLGEAELNLSPSTVSFDDVVVGEQSASLVITVTNAGGAPSDVLDTALDGADAGNFLIVTDACIGTTLATGAACAIEVAFAPLTRGATSAILSVNDVAATLTGVALADATLVLSPASRDFGTVGLGTQSTELNFTVTNLGDVASGPIDEVIEGDAADFAISVSDCDGTVLAANESCTISMIFAPSSALVGSIGALRVSASPGGEATSALTGTATTVEFISISPTAADFGALELAQTSTGQTFTVNNDGGATTGVLSTTLSGTDAGQFTVLADACDGITLAAGTTCDVSIAFAPTTAGDRAATLVVTDATGSVVIASLTGVATFPPPLTVAPTGIDFGSVAAGFQSAIATIVVSNPSASVFGTPSVTLGGANFTQFEIVDTTCAAPLAPSESCVVRVRYRPTVGQALHNATLTFISVPGGSAITQLAGTALSREGLGFVSSPDYAPGDVVIGTQAATTVTLTVRNKGPDTGTISTVLIGSGAASFVIVSEDCTTLTPNATCSITVRFDPQAPAGPKVAQLSVSEASAPTPIASRDFTGNAIEP